MIAATLVFKNQLAQNLREPAWLFIGLAQPVLYLVLFGPLLERMAEPFGVDPWLLFTPGMLVLLAMWGGMTAGFGIVAELRAGVVERQRVTPAGRLSLLTGRILRDVAVVTVQGVILVAFAIPFGLRPSWPGVALTLVLVALLTAGIASVSIAQGLATKTEGGVAAMMNGLQLPIMLLAGILIPMQFAPGWLETLSRFNPVTYTVDAARALFAGELGSSDVIVGCAVTILLTAALMAVGVRRFQRENA
jgi:ABC-2 type transport system permease protein